MASWFEHIEKAIRHHGTDIESGHQSWGYFKIKQIILCSINIQVKFLP